MDVRWVVVRWVGGCEGRWTGGWVDVRWVGGHEVDWWS